MPDRDAFIRMINAQPEDDGPRLVYADWLEETGDCDRAEFIRLQIELTKVPAGGPRTGVMKTRADKLLWLHRRAWEPEFNSPALNGKAWGYSEPNPIEFRRGFPELTIRIETLAEIADQLGDTCPVPVVHLRGPLLQAEGPRFLPALARLANHPVLTRVASVSMNLSDLELRLLLDAPQLTNLRRLNLQRGGGVSARGIESLAAAPNMQSVTQL